MLTSNETDKLDAALAKAQAEFKTVARDSKNPHFRSTYASLTAIWNEVRPALGRAGISITQHPIRSESPARLVLLTRVSHAGQWMCSECEVPLAKQDVQGWGAALTYAKRYALTAILGLADDDDDGETDAGRGGEDSTANSKPSDWENSVGNRYTKAPSLVKKEIVNHAPKLSPMQQVGNAIKGRNKEVIGAWIRAKYKNLDPQAMTQGLAEEIMKKIKDTPDEGFNLELSELQGRSSR